MAISELELPSGVLAHSLVSAEQLAQTLAERVAGALDYAVATHGFATLVVSGGRSPVAFFEALSVMPLDWNKVMISLADERWVRPDDINSNEGLVRRHLLRNVAAEAELIGLYQPAESLERSAELAGAALERLRPPIDVLVLGMGDDGHTASLFADSPLLARGLDPDEEALCLPMLAPTEPRERISMTLSLMASARVQCLAIQGQQKLETLRRVIQSDPERMPVRAFLNAPLEIYWCP